MIPFSQMTVVLLSFAIAAASPPAKPAAPAKPAVPAKSSAPLSKYARAHLERMRVSAPADEYFGKMKISFLGINNTFRDAALTAGDHTTDSGVINKVAFAEDALKDWEKKYPRDPQLARSYYLGIAVEKKIWVQANQQQSWAYMNRIAQVFPNTYFGKLVKREMAIGFTEHYYSDAIPCPAATPTATPTPVPTPTPVATPTVAPHARAPRATPTPVATPSPVPTPAATPTPEPTPTPMPEIKQLGKGLKVQVLTPPCVAAPTPSPSPSPSPSPVPTATPAAAPAPSPPAALPSALPVPIGSPTATPTPRSRP